VMVSGAPPEILERLRQELAPFGLVPMQGGLAGKDQAAEARLEPGAPLAVDLVRGDIRATVMGTITEVIGDRLYGFGHAMFGMGEADYPLMTGVAQVVVPSLFISFRLGASSEDVGRLVWDEQTAVFGRIGPGRATMVPLRVTVCGPDEGTQREFEYEMIQHRIFSPILAGRVPLTSLFARSALPRDYTLSYRISFKPVGQEPVVCENLCVSPDGQKDVFGRILDTLRYLMDNPFENLTVESVEVRVEVEPKSRQAQITEARLLRNAVRPGDTVPAEMRIKPWHAEPIWIPVEVAVPADYPEGSYRLTLCGADEALQHEMQETPARFDVRDLEGMLWVLRHDLRRDQLFMRLGAPGEGLAIGTEELPNLPASWRTMLTDAARLQVSGIRPVRVTTRKMDYVLFGEVGLEVTVDRHAPEP